MRLRKENKSKAGPGHDQAVDPGQWGQGAELSLHFRVELHYESPKCLPWTTGGTRPRNLDGRGLWDSGPWTSLGDGTDF